MYGRSVCLIVVNLLELCYEQDRHHHLHLHNQMTKLELDKFVAYEALALPVGGSTRTICPACRATHEQSFRIIRTEHNLSYRCWRMKCGVRGVVGSIGRHGAMPNKSIAPRPLTYKTTHVQEYEQALVWHRYGIGGEALRSYGVLWCEALESLVFPCYSLTGDALGFATKSLGNTYGGLNKASLFWNTDDIPMYYAPAPHKLSHRGGTVVLVEDCLSCLKILEAGHASLALLGTKLWPTTAMEIANVYRNVVFCLDNDATVKSVELAKEYNLLFDKVSILVPRVDPKDMPMDELENLLYDGG